MFPIHGQHFIVSGIKKRISTALLLMSAVIISAALFSVLPYNAPAAFATVEGEGADNVAEVVSPDGTSQSYTSLVEAVSQAPSGSTVKLLSDLSLGSYSYNATNISLLIDKSITVDGQNHTLTVAADGIYISGGADVQNLANVTLKNIAIVNPDASGCAVIAADGYKTLTFDAVSMSTTGSGETQTFAMSGNTPQVTNVTFNACSINASSKGYGIITFNPANLNINDTQITGYGCIYMKGADGSAGSSGSSINITSGSTLKSSGISGESGTFGAVVFEDTNNSTLNIQDSAIDVISPSDAGGVQCAVMFSSKKGADGKVSSNNKVRFSGDQTTVATEGANSCLLSGNNVTNTVEISGGTYHLSGGIFSVPNATQGVDLKVSGGEWSLSPNAFAANGYTTYTQSNGTYFVAPLLDESLADSGTGNSGLIAEGDGQQTKLPYVSGTNGSGSPSSVGSPTLNGSPTAQNPHVGGQNTLQQTGDMSVNPLVPLVALIASVMLLALALSLRQREKASS